MERYQKTQMTKYKVSMVKCQLRIPGYRERSAKEKGITSSHCNQKSIMTHEQGNEGQEWF